MAYVRFAGRGSTAWVALVHLVLLLSANAVNAQVSASDRDLQPAPEEAPVEITVEGERPQPMRSSLQRAEIRQVPGAFGDPFRAVEVLPGVTPVISGLPFFYVRGAPPGNVGYFLDGVRVPYLYHIGLGPSVIHPGLVERVDLYPGAYPARFGRFAGGIVSGETRAPTGEFHGEGNLRVFDAGALVESSFADGRGSALLGGRYSYTAAIISLVAPDVQLDYRDYQARVTYDVTPRDRLTAFSFGTYDVLANTEYDRKKMLFGAEFYRVDLRHDHAFETGGNLRTAVTLGYDQNKIEQERRLESRMLGVRSELDLAFGSRAKFRAGLAGDVEKFGADPQRYVDPDDRQTTTFDALSRERTDTITSAHAELTLDADRMLQFTPGMRLDYYMLNGRRQLAPEPRFAARVRASDSLSFVHAYGLAHQPAAFAFPMPGVPSGVDKGKLQSALQVSSGVELKLPAAVFLSANVFHNTFLNLSDSFGLQTEEDDNPARVAERSDGRAYGVEVFVRRSLTRHLGGFVSYTLSRSERRIKNRELVSAFDRTHVANAALTYNLGRKWRAGTRLVYYTGVPKQRATPESKTPKGREKNFFRVDLRLEKRWDFQRERWLSVVTEVLNATLSDERAGGESVGPLTIPSIGVEGGF
jgi:hypothetical protein